MRSTRGFTIVEALVAVLILTVGLLGLVTTSGVVTRMIGQGRRATLAAGLAGERLEVMRARGCPDEGVGSETRDGVTVAWEVGVPPVPRARTLLVRVQWVTPRGPRGDSIATLLHCP
ncbi:MAG TPA: prepilin-type N-terminal cleavage/methylation domain-containing protein [Gemmatimonadales bacterium]|jgi:Tfp pilus assembly protein PilV